MLLHVAIQAKWVWDLAWFASRAAWFNPAAFVRGLARGARICRRGRFTPEEAFRLDLFRPPSDRGGRFPVLSRRQVTRLQKVLNPESAAPLARDKSLFYRHCMTVGVPIPALYALFFPGKAGVATDGTALSNRQDWERFISDSADFTLPDGFVIKPALGSMGQGVGLFSRVPSGFRDALGGIFTAAELYDRLVADGGQGGMILQERLAIHPELVRLTGTPYLQTLRMITLLDDAESCRILHSHLKVIVDHRVLDNSAHDGPASAVRAAVDVLAGRLIRAVQTPANRPGFRTLAVHPKTGIPFAGFQLPFWPDVRDLVRRTAPLFWPLRTIGWDIALTPTGPRVVEGNVWWDPPQGQLSLPTLVAELAKAAGAAGAAGSSEAIECDPDSPRFP
jgi:hypothetical protein